MIPGERSILAGERNHRRHDLREVSDKAAVEIAESDEGLDIGQAGRRPPVTNSLNLLEVHADTVSADNHSEELSFGHEELARRDLGEESSVS